MVLNIGPLDWHSSTLTTRPLLNGSEMGQEMPKIEFFELKEKIVFNFHRICSIIKIFIICCIPEQILWEIFFLIYRPKFSQPVRLQKF